MREDIKKTLDILELNETKEYIKELNSKIEKQQLKIDIFEMIIIHFLGKEIFKDEKS